MSSGWVRVCAIGELLPGETAVVWDGDVPILVVNYDGDYYALEDRCSHEDFELSAGPFDAVYTSKPWNFRLTDSSSTILVSSSTTRTRASGTCSCTGMAIALNVHRCGWKSAACSLCTSCEFILALFLDWGA